MPTAPAGGTEATAGAAAAAPSASDSDGNLYSGPAECRSLSEVLLADVRILREGLIDQLSSEYGEKLSVADKTAAVDNLNVDWNAHAARSAAAYLKMSGFSCQGLIDQLSPPNGVKFTVEQATYGAGRAGIC